MDNLDTQTIKCQFCEKSFASKSTYGRHLDSKRADPLHPDSEVDAIRKNVVRRGENRQVSSDRQLVSKTTRQKVSRTYNSKQEVKEKNKRRRKERDVGIKAMLHAHNWYLSKLASGRIDEPKTFIEMVALYIVPLKWPDLGKFPGEAEFQKLLATLVGKLAPHRVFASWEEWKKYDGDKLGKWQHVSDKALRHALGESSLYEIVNCVDLVAKKQQENYDEYSQSDLYNMLVSECES